MSPSNAASHQIILPAVQAHRIDRGERKSSLLNGNEENIDEAFS